MQCYYEYISSNTNEDKCKITRVCAVDSLCKVKEYLEKIKAPEIRSVFTKFRIDINNIMDCKNRSFRYKHVTSSLCSNCNETQHVYHVMFACNMDTIYKHRQNFEDIYSRYVKDFTRRCNQDKLKEIMNVNPRCSGANREQATEVICNYIKILYNMINASIIET